MVHFKLEVRCPSSLAARVESQSRQIHRCPYGDLSEYVPAWLSQIEKRRALMWSKVPDAQERESVSEISTPEYFSRRFDD